MTLNIDSHVEAIEQNLKHDHCPATESEIGGRAFFLEDGW